MSADLRWLQMGTSRKKAPDHVRESLSRRMQEILSRYPNQKAAAKGLQCSQGQISEVLNKKREPRLGLLLAMASELDVSLGALCGITGHEVKSASEMILAEILPRIRTEMVGEDDAKVSLTARIIPALPSAPASPKRKRRRA